MNLLDSTGIPKKLQPVVIWVVVAIVVLILFFILKKTIQNVIDKIRANNFEKNVDKDLNQYVLKFFALLHASWGGYDADEKGLINLAKEITKKEFAQINKLFFSKNKVYLTDELQGCLNGEEQIQFNANLQEG